MFDPPATQTPNNKPEVTRPPVATVKPEVPVETKEPEVIEEPEPESTGSTDES